MILDGKAVAEKVLNNVKEDVAKKLKAKENKTKYMG